MRSIQSYSDWVRFIQSTVLEAEKLILNERKFRKLSPVGLLLGPGTSHFTGMFHKHNTIMVNLFIIFAMVDPPIFNEVFTQAKQRSNLLSSSFMVFYSTPKKSTKEIIGTAKHLCCKQDMRSCECKFRLHNQTKQKKVKSICDLNSKCGSFFRPPFEKG